MFKLKNLYLFVWGVVLASCVSVAPQPSVDSVLKTEPIQVRRSIKDIDYRMAQTDKSPKKKIVILPFVEKNADQGNLRPESVRQNARTAFINELNQMDQFIVLEGSDLVESEKYLKGSEYNLALMAKESQKSGISSIIEGQIIDVRLKKSADQVGVIRQLKATYEVVVRMRIVNVRSEQEVFHTVKTVTLDEENTRIAERVSADQMFVKNPELVEVLIKDAFLDFTEQIKSALNEVTWEGRIATIRGDKIYLNVGRMSGVQIGDLLKVVEDGSEIYDPELGYHLGQVHGKVKGTLEIISYFGNDGAVGIIHSGAGFKERDRVELYQ